MLWDTLYLRQNFKKLDIDTNITHKEMFTIEFLNFTCMSLSVKVYWAMNLIFASFFFSTSAKAPEDSKCWQPTVIFIRSTNHKWPYKLSLTIHFHQSYHFSLTFTIVITPSCSHAVRRSWFTSCVIGEGHQNQKVQRPSRWVSQIHPTLLKFEFIWNLEMEALDSIGAISFSI